MASSAAGFFHCSKCDSLKGGMAYPLGVREGLAGGTARALEKMLIDLQNSSDNKALFMDIPAGKFWYCCRAPFPNLAKKAFEVIVPFLTTYRCEQSFSVMIV